jgi:hypothetical protein
MSIYRVRSGTQVFKRLQPFCTPLTRIITYILCRRYQVPSLKVHGYRRQYLRLQNTECWDNSALTEVIPRNLPEVTEENYRKTQNSRYSCRDSNRAPAEYEITALQQQQPVWCEAVKSVEIITSLLQ